MVGPIQEPFMGEQLNIESADFHYDYPVDLKLKPGEEDHAKLVGMVLDRARASWRVISGRHAAWDEIKRTLTAYIPLSEEEEEVITDDTRKPVSIVVPQSFAVLDTLMTQCMDTFLSDTVFRYRGVGPEDTRGALLMERVVELQVERFKGALGLHTAWRDGFAYGIGASTPIWTQEIGKRLRPKTIGARISDVFGQLVGGETQDEYVDEVIYEGNRIEPIDPYTLLPDPNVSIHQIQQGEFIGWTTHDNRMSLLTREGDRLDGLGPEGLFNIKYLRFARDRTSHFSGRSTSVETGRGMNLGDRLGSHLTNPVDVVWMYINLVPKEWKLGKGETPEKWMFAVAADTVLIAAQPLGLDHNRFPVAICAPEFDGYETSPLSRLETTYGLQKGIDWMWNSHQANQRKAINDMIIYDPMLVSAKDMEDPKPGKLVRLRKSAWGRGVDNVAKQLMVNDITRGNIPDMAVLIDLMERGSGATDTLQGISRKGGERRSATEIRSTTSSAASRIDRAITVIAVQYMQDMGYMFASQTQQLMDADSYIQAIGSFGRELAEEYGVDVQGERALVTPGDLDMMYDVVSYSNAQKGSEFADSALRALEIAASQPELAQRVDLWRLFSHTMRLMGVRNIQDFKRDEGQTNVQVMPDEQVLDQADRGNLIPQGAVT